MFLDNLPSVVQSRQFLNLTHNSLQYGRDNCRSSNYYYEAVEINTMQSDIYTLAIQSQGYLDTSGFLYQQHFDPYEPTKKLLIKSFDGCSENRMKITSLLKSNITYVLVISTRKEHELNKFLIITSGPSNVTMKNIRKYNILCSFPNE